MYNINGPTPPVQLCIDIQQEFWLRIPIVQVTFGSIYPNVYKKNVFCKKSQITIGIYDDYYLG